MAKPQLKLIRIFLERDCTVLVCVFGKLRSAVTAGPSGSTDPRSSCRDLFILSQCWGARWHQMPQTTSSWPSTDGFSKSTCRKTPERTRSQACHPHGKSSGVFCLARPGLLDSPVLEQGQPTQSHGVASPRAERGSVARSGREQMLSRHNSSCPPHLWMQKAVCRAFCMGQAATDNCSLIHTGSEHFPLLCTFSLGL